MLSFQSLIRGVAALSAIALLALAAGCSKPADPGGAGSQTCLGRLPSELRTLEAVF